MFEISGRQRQPEPRRDSQLRAPATNLFNKSWVTATEQGYRVDAQPTVQLPVALEDWEYLL